MLDRQSELLLTGVAVELLDVEAGRGTTTDADGRFVLTGVPVGRRALRFSYLGYETLTLPNVMVTAGKEVLLEVERALTGCVLPKFSNL